MAHARSVAPSNPKRDDSCALYASPDGLQEPTELDAVTAAQDTEAPAPLAAGSDPHSGASKKMTLKCSLNTCTACLCTMAALIGLGLAFVFHTSVARLSLQGLREMKAEVGPTSHAELHHDASSTFRPPARDRPPSVDDSRRSSGGSQMSASDIKLDDEEARPIIASRLADPPAKMLRPEPTVDPRADWAKSADVCNLTAPVPKMPTYHRWDISDSWRRVCEKKNAKDQYPYERNWCWVGWKQMCHWNLKNHVSWRRLQEKASGLGSTPPPEAETFSPLSNPELCDVAEHGAVRNWTAEEYEQARDWFRNNVAVYVLNLPTSYNRWDMINKRLQELQIWATRVPGVDMRVPGALAKARGEGFVPAEYNFSEAQRNAYSWKQAMGSIMGTLGCASAHFKVHSKIIADGAPMAVVMEDDSWPTDDFVPRLWSLVTRELPCDWEVTALLSRCPYGSCVSKHLLRVEPDVNEPAWRCHQGVNWGMHAILYRTQTLAKVQMLWKRAVFNETNPRCMDVDVALASLSDRVSFYAVPAVQDPGFLKETNHRSARWDINQAARTTNTQTTTRTTFMYVPTLKPGEPWPGAWNYG